MSASTEVVLLQRDCFALMVPSGARIMLYKGTEVAIVQALGDSFTVNVYGNLARIEASEADALGKTVKDPLADVAADASVEQKCWLLLKTIFDPEIPVNVVDLGLIYQCVAEQQADGQYEVYIQMTLTAPGCGMGPVIAEEAKRKIMSIPEVSTTEVEIVFDPPWDRDMLSDEAKLQLGLF